MTSKEYWFWLLNIDKIGNRKIKGILDFYGCPKEAFNGNIKDLKEIKNLTKEDRLNIVKSKDIKLVKESYNKLNEKGIYFVTIKDKDYPLKLKNIYDPPYGLYVKGKLPNKDKVSIGVVGARNCSDYGRAVAMNLSKELSEAGIEIISGLAYGIDTYAHIGALNGSGSTYGVLGCGVDVCYPKENFSTYMKIQERGGIISEYGIGVSPRPFQFPMRNRIISGLSDGILVIEAKEKSGSFITVDAGLEQGKNIYAVPGNIYDSLSAGCNNLLKMGAKTVTSPDDIIEDFIYNFHNSRDNKLNKDKLLERKEKIVYACLSHLPKHMNEIAGETNLHIDELSVILLQLEIKKLAKEIRKNYYTCIS